MSTSLAKRVVCVCALVRKDDRILLVRQATGHSLEGQWTLPWGFLDEDEMPSDAILREIEEESGIVAKVAGVIGIQVLPSPWEDWIALIFSCDHIKGSPKPDMKETDRASYFSRRDLDKLDEPVEEWCSWLARKALTHEAVIVFSDPENPYQPCDGYL
jgi:ADP-ribose pyrophosphatase YjhB (NUDIX family)